MESSNRFSTRRDNLTSEPQSTLDQRSSTLNAIDFENNGLHTELTIDDLEVIRERFESGVPPDSILQHSDERNVLSASSFDAGSSSVISSSSLEKHENSSGKSGGNNATTIPSTR